MIRCLIVDDEPPARDLIALHLSRQPQFEVAASLDNAPDAAAFLQQNAVDLLFLDIRMPRVSGLELIRSLKVCPKIILTTAYREFAVEAFELDVLDYLVKPVTEERFRKALSKFQAYNGVPAAPAAPPDPFANAYIFLKVGKGSEKVYLRDIRYIEGLKDFVKVHTSAKVFVASERLSYMEEKLPESKFARVHKSFIVSLERITGIQGDAVRIGDTELPLGRVYKNGFLKKVLPPPGGCQ
ncbi:MAG TPA: LytTR family DNA-binding domain-containing protein [Chitinophagaceae bacterium]|jgi:DNA-binding LytR/AlgR family response regulator|nr:LytTR family DNA-binding domain-containing protein [Chitinophagaceae bacterium]